MNIYIGLLFNQGHLQSPALVRSLAAEPAAAAPVDGDAPPPQDGASREDATACSARRRGWAAVCGATALSMFR